MVKSESVVNTRERGCSSDIRTRQASATDIGRARYRRIKRSIALAYDLTLVTHNAEEFSRVPRLRVEDWFER